MPNEVAALNSPDHLWSPRTIDFDAVMQTPNAALGKNEQIECRPISYVQDFVELFTHSQGNERPRRSLRRVNIIGHGQQRLIGLKGKVDFTTGGLGLDPPMQPPPNSPPQTESEQRLAETRFDNATIHWLNHDGVSYRDQIREKLADDAEIALLLCYSGSLDGHWLMNQIAETFRATVLGFTKPFGYAPTVKGRAIDKRNRTYIDITRMGFGYPCWVSVPDEFAGKHIVFDATSLAPGRAGQLAGRAAWIASHIAGHLPIPNELPE
jgi:hypothetical protein